MCLPMTGVLIDLLFLNGNNSKKVRNWFSKRSKVNFFEVDCEKDQATADKFKIDGYPTIKMVL